MLIWGGGQVAWAQQENLDLAKEYRQMDLDARTDVVQYVYVDPPRGLEVSLMVINTSWREIAFTLEAMTASGTWEEIAEVPTEPRRSFALPIPTDAVGRIKLLRIAYFDLPDAIAAQVLYSSSQSQAGQETYAVPFLVPGATGDQLVAWAGADEEALELTLVNAGDEPLSYSTTVNGSVREHSAAPFATKRHVVEETSAIVEIRSGDLEQIVVWAHETGSGHTRVALPLASASSLIEATGYASTHIPNQDGLANRVEVTVANLADSGASIPWYLIDNASGEVVAAETVSLDAGEVATYDLTSQWGTIEDCSAFRLEAGPTSTPFLAHGVVELPNGVQTELSLQGLTSGHGSGRYPVPAIDVADSTLNLVNLGSQTALVAGKLNWDGGEYLIEPMEIPSKASAVVDVRVLVETSDDIPSNLTGGFLEWLAMKGSSEIIGRLEITLADSQDPIGINCQQCCSQVPFGLVVPGEVTLTSPGQLKSFETDIKYNTCSGQTGPYYLPPDDLDFSAPFSWDSKKVSASSGAEDELSFSGRALGVRWDCAQANFLVLGSGKVKGCKLWLIYPGCKNSYCDESKTCWSLAKDNEDYCQNCCQCCVRQALYWCCEKKAGWFIDQKYQQCNVECNDETDCNTPCGPRPPCP